MKLRQSLHYLRLLSQPDIKNLKVRNIFPFLSVVLSEIAPRSFRNKHTSRDVMELTPSLLFEKLK